MVSISIKMTHTLSKCSGECNATFRLLDSIERQTLPTSNGYNPLASKDIPDDA